MAAPRGSEVWRDYVTDGIPSSGNNNPKKSDARAWSSWLESLVTSGVLSSGPWFATKAAMTLGYVANTIAVVYNDPTAANNGLYIKSGASGAGAWTQLTSFLPGYQFVTASPTGESTANAIVALTSPRLPSGDGVALVTLAIPATNTATPVTVRFDDGDVLTIKTRTGEDPDAGELQQNDVVAGFVSGGTYRLISDLNSLRNFRSAKAWANNDEDVPVPTDLGGNGATTFSAKHWAAKADEDADRSETARAGSEAARDIALGYASDAVSQGNVPIYGTAIGLAGLSIPDGINFLRTNGFSVPNGIGSAHYRLKAAGEPDSPWDRLSNAGAKRWAIAEVDVTPAMFGAVADGVSDIADFVEIAIQASYANRNNIPSYSTVPYAADVSIRIPAAPLPYFLSRGVDTKGISVTYHLDEGTVFAGGSVNGLRGRIVRGGKKGHGFPFGLMTHATGDTVTIGNSSYDNEPQVTGITLPQNISMQTVDLVGRYTDVSGQPLAHSSAATYTATTATFTDALPKDRYRVGMVVQTRHATAYRGIVTSISADYKTVTVEGWYPIGSTIAGTPDSTGSPILDFNVFHKVWGQNTNIYATTAGYSYQGAAHEYGIINNKVAPVAETDEMGRFWGIDAVNLGLYKVAAYFMARGSGLTGYRAAGMDVAFKAAALGSGYGAPSMGFLYEGGGTGFRANTGAGVQTFAVNGGVIDLGNAAAANVPALDFRNGDGAPDYTARLYSTGGTGATGSGNMLVDASTFYTRHHLPAADNVSNLGGSSNRWANIYGVSVISPSDPALKHFIHDDETMEILTRVARRIPIRLYQWLAAVALKGDDARIHIGISAREVEEAFAAEGLDPRRFGVFCEDEEMETVEVESFIDVQDVEIVVVETLEHEEREDRVVVMKTMKEVHRLKTVKKPISNEDGSPVLHEIVDEDASESSGRIVKRWEILEEVEVPVMTKKRVVDIKRVPTGRKALSIRYDQLAMLMISAHESRLTKLEAAFLD
ncbi:MULTISPECIES: tail fiber domain-containing protein [Agrobacterium]|uniref:tail fiber domain-containing protein n=1 Tax=Agrobacterium TaxID=357 RepID=UPI0027809CF2|nr:hypothetical protein [Agrobacterium sp. SORGH_AS_0745]MDP9758329.1 hypothetical protein [Agrobacterium tumefaciens]MDQ1219568.1 hypothetical protein [Agrobacterium sp. SORGH_AS_0745]